MWPGWCAPYRQIAWHEPNDWKHMGGGLYERELTQQETQGMSSTSGGTLDGMTIAQLRELAQRAEATAKEKEKATKAADKYTVSSAVQVSPWGTLVCASKDGQGWLTVDGGWWVSCSDDYKDVIGALVRNGVFPYQYADYKAFRTNHRPTYGKMEEDQ